MNVFSIVLIMSLVGCGVEVSNPEIEDDNTGKVTISIDTGDKSGLGLTRRRSFELYLESIELRGYNETVKLSESVGLNKEVVDLFSGEGDVNLGEGNISPGTYTSLILNLRQERPFRYRPDGENEELLEFEDSTYRAIYVPQYLTIVDSGEQVIHLDFDVLSSIVTQDDRKIFRPRVEGFRKDRVMTYSGTVEQDNAVQVCAYLYAPFRPPLPPPPKDGSLPPPIGAVAKEWPSFATREDLIVDELPTCNNAFVVTPVAENGKFSFNRLRPGRYVFRAFFSDDSYLTIAEGVELRP